MTDTSAGTRRLMIRDMVLDNFKSYAGPQRVGPFHKSFSSVVGPNGSGKSNVIDAMLFVFGRRAKQLRFNKVSELIHNSTNFRNLEQARVTVYFQEIIDKEGEDYVVIPDTEFTVARTANRNNTSDYYINSRKVSSKEVTDKLKAMGIDLDNNRFLILQGEVEQISMMKPKAEDKNDTGLLEYLEDIIGTDKYVQPIEDASKKLEEISDRRQGMVARLKIAEKEKEGLEGKKAEAEMFLKHQGSMLQKKITANEIFISRTGCNLAFLDGQMSKLTNQLEYERNKYAAYDKEAKEAEKRVAAAEKELSTVQKALEAAQEEFKGFERKDAKAQIEGKNLRAKVKKLTQKIETDTAEAMKLEGEVAEIEGDAPRARERLAQLQQELAAAEQALEGVLDGVKGEVEGYHQELSKVRAELAPWEKKIGEVSGRVSVAASERDALARKAEDAKKRLDAALKGLAGAQQSAAARQQQIKDIEAATKRCRQQIEAHKADQTAVADRSKQLEEAVGEASARVNALRADIQGASNQSGLVVGLMTGKARGDLTGVYGRLGDLGAIDPQYDVAVSTAVGGLDYIVVDTASDAQRAVEYLRKHNLGVATFLILEKQKHLAAAASEKVQTPDGVPRLYDLVKIKDDKLRPAFFYAMGNTLVAQDLTQASRIAYGSDRRFRRVVTLQGQLIAESGTMSGGGGKPSKGRMALGTAAPRGTAAADAKAAMAEMKEAEKTHEKLCAELRDIRNQAAAVESALKAAEKQLAELEMAAPKARMEAEAETQKAADIQQRLDALKEATKVGADDAEKIAELSLTIAREERAIADLKAQTAGLERQAAALQAKIDSAGGEKLKKAKATVTKLQKDISDGEADAAKKAVLVKAAAKQVEKLHKDVSKDEKEKAKVEGDLAKLEADVKNMEEDAIKVMEEVEVRKAELEERQATVNTVREEAAEINSRHATIRKVELDLEAKLEEMNKNKKGAEAKVETWKSEVRKLKAQLKGVVEVIGSEGLPGAEQEQEAGAQDEDVEMEDAEDDEEQEADMEDDGGPIKGPEDEVEVDKATGQRRWKTGSEGQYVWIEKANELLFQASVLESECNKMSPDMAAIEEYRAKAADYAARAAELDAVTSERDQVRREYEGLRKARLDDFMAGFNTISLRLKEMYQMITLGGDAELELVDSLDPFSEGIVFSVRPPKKSWKNISNLSGGEKTLSSLSLVFALHHYKPTPLYVMDEIDAALDFKNVSIVGHYIKERTRNAQFVIISLRNNMFELADRLVGIYKTDNTTKTVTINPGHFVLPTPTGAAKAPGQQGAQEAPQGAEAEADDGGKENAGRAGSAPVGKGASQAGLREAAGAKVVGVV